MAEINKGRPAGAEASGALILDRPRLLVVDDDPDILRIVKYYLVRQNFDVETATNGEEALEIIRRSGKIELLLSDVMMPRMNGLDLLRAVRGLPGRSDLPIILISAEGEAKKKVAGLDMGADDYLTKPFNFDELIARVRNHIRLRRLQKELIAANDLLRRRNAQFMENLEAARAIQAALMPDRFPASTGFTVGSRYLPMAEVGGDFFDVVTLAGGRKLGVFIADVCGHGVASAFITAMTKITFRNACFGSEDPAGVLAQMNRELCLYSKHSFVTACYGIYDTAARTFTYAGGGHPPLLVRRGSSGAVIELGSQATFLGFFEDVPYTADSIAIEAGDRIFLYTDGLYESRNAAHEQYGMERFTRFIRDEANGDIQTTLDQLLEDLTRFMGNTAVEDDVTIVGFDVSA
ncbi:MAG: SpoIIE family protein phosphatase [Candidatus Lambdaproteobacteria bacterium]|nr:SpoIIE family protein phosphatase [Candidatus Lambdaproteobacteria bacterium]